MICIGNSCQGRNSLHDVLTAVYFIHLLQLKVDGDECDACAIDQFGIMSRLCGVEALIEIVLGAVEPGLVIVAKGGKNGKPGTVFEVAGFGEPEAFEAGAL